MPVNPSAAAGFAAQLLDNNGVILTGGKIYTYVAGTTTPQATYTDSLGITAHTNPIILDSAGRVPGGEIWLTGGASYKFVIETSTGSLLGTYDNIFGINDLSFVTGTVSSANVSFLQAGTSAVTRTAQAKMRDTVSVLDFGAVGNGVTDDTAAFVAAMATGKRVYAPKGTYRINLVLSQGSRTLVGDGIGQTIFRPAVAANPVITINGDIAGTIISYFTFEDFSIQGETKQGHGISIVNTSDLRGCDFLSLSRLSISSCDRGFSCTGRSIWNSFTDVRCSANKDGWWIQTPEACNTWTLINCGAGQNDRHGFYAFKTDVSIAGFIDWTFINFNTEYNGLDTSYTTIYGLYCNGAQGWTLLNCTSERPGQNIVGITSYGFFFDGPLGRGVIIDGGWVVDSTYGIAFAGDKKSGKIDNIYTLLPYAGGQGIYITAQWLNDEPKIELGPNINGSISVTYDINGNWPITQGVDYIASSTSLTTLNLKNRKSVSINTQNGTAALTTITGLISGDTIFIFNFGGGGTLNDVTLAAGLMFSTVGLYTIPVNTGKTFKVLGFPQDGRLVAI